MGITYSTYAIVSSSLDFASIHMDRDDRWRVSVAWLEAPRSMRFHRRVPPCCPFAAKALGQTLDVFGADVQLGERMEGRAPLGEGGGIPTGVLDLAEEIRAVPLRPKLEREVHRVKGAPAGGAPVLNAPEGHLSHPSLHTTLILLLVDRDRAGRPSALGTMCQPVLGRRGCGVQLHVLLEKPMCKAVAHCHGPILALFESL